MSAVHASDVLAALRVRYAQPEWAMFAEVRGGNGWAPGSETSADGVAMATWPSLDYEIHGFEIKVARSDWLRERGNEQKSEAVRRYCDRWWLVAPRDIARTDELPGGWGLMLFDDGKVRVGKAAPPLAPVPLDRKFAASLLRAAATYDKREEALAQKALFLSSPLRAVTGSVGKHWEAKTLTLSCGHSVTRPAGATPKTVRCLECRT